MSGRGSVTGAELPYPKPIQWNVDARVQPYIDRAIADIDKYVLVSISSLALVNDAKQIHTPVLPP